MRARGIPGPANLSPIDLLIRDLHDVQQDLGRYISDLDSIDEHDRYRSAIELYGNLTSRIGRLLKVKRDLEGGGGEDLKRALDGALDAIGLELKIKL